MMHGLVVRERSFKMIVRLVVGMSQDLPGLPNVWLER
jgi:hypothetical protein